MSTAESSQQERAAPTEAADADGADVTLAIAGWRPKHLPHGFDTIMPNPRGHAGGCCTVHSRPDQRWLPLPRRSFPAEV